jgi:hypothetical protein
LQGRNRKADKSDEKRGGYHIAVNLRDCVKSGLVREAIPAFAGMTRYQVEKEVWVAEAGTAHLTTNAKRIASICHTAPYMIIKNNSPFREDTGY